MKKGQGGTKLAGVSDDAVMAKTGKAWVEWFEILDAAGARNMDHKTIVAYLVENHGVPDWWCQMVTVGYEQARGKRQKHETPEGYQVSGNKTIAVPVEAVYKAWVEEKLRRQWLPDGVLTITKANPGKSLRIAWDEGQTRVDVNFYAKGPDKSQVQVGHTKLPDSAEGERMRAFWRERRERLKELIESGTR